MSFLCFWRVAGGVLVASEENRDWLAGMHFFKTGFGLFACLVVDFLMVDLLGGGFLVVGSFGGGSLWQ